MMMLNHYTFVVQESDRLEMLHVEDDHYAELSFRDRYFKPRYTDKCWKFERQFAVEHMMVLKIIGVLCCTKFST